MSKNFVAPSKTLGPVSAKFINEMQKNGKSIFSLADAAHVYGKSHYETTKFLGGLLKRGILFRLRAGVYLILKAGKENIQLSNWPIIARELVKDRHYFISHYSAMRLHGMTTHPLMKTYITTYKRMQDKQIANISYHFIFCKKENFWGCKLAWVSKEEQVMVSDIERTLLDSCARPELCGGIKEIARAIWNKQSDINWHSLLNYSKKYNIKSAIKRLGFLVELLEISPNFVNQLLKEKLLSSGYNLLEPYANDSGQHEKKWNLKINVNINEIKASVWA